MQAYPGRDPIAEYWRGEITLRKLRVMVRYMPPENAVQAQRNDGVWWSDLHALVNLVEFRLRENTSQVIASSGRRAKPPKYKAKPWEKSGDRMGDLAGRSSAEAKAFLDSLAPPKQ